jgi:hypothetical protein
MISNNYKKPCGDVNAPRGEFTIQESPAHRPGFLFRPVPHQGTLSQSVGRTFTGCTPVLLAGPREWAADPVRLFQEGVTLLADGIATASAASSVRHRSYQRTISFIIIIHPLLWAVKDAVSVNPRLAANCMLMCNGSERGFGRGALRGRAFHGTIWRVRAPDFPRLAGPRRPYHLVRPSH